MTEPTPAGPGAPGFTMLGGDDAATCTDDACLLPGLPGAATAQPAAQ